MVSCRDVVALATDYTEGQLGWRMQVQIRLHLAMCAICRRYLQQLALTTKALRRLAGPDTSAGTPPALRELFKQWKADRRRVAPPSNSGAAPAPAPAPIAPRQSRNNRLL
jgi:predicted anti-sigma-YlaC factor YlaD